MLTSPKSRISPVLDTGGADVLTAETSSRSQLRPVVWPSLTLKLAALVGMFVALPVVLYGQFAGADQQMRELVVRSIQHRTALVAEALKPALEQFGTASPRALNDILSRYGDNGTSLHLMLQPKGEAAKSGFYYVAAAPPIGAEQLSVQLATLRQNGILGRLSQGCDIGKDQEFRYQSGEQKEVLTSIIPLQTRTGCWALVSSHATADYLDTSIGRPYWQTPEVQWAALIYIMATALAGFIAWRVWANLRHFQTVAREIRTGGVGKNYFASRGILPELSGAARDFDQLVRDMHDIAIGIRRTAEDNAHSFKSPVATIKAAVSTIKRAVPDIDGREKRAVELIDASVERLTTLINAAQKIDNNIADMIVAPHTAQNLSAIVDTALHNYRDVFTQCSIQVFRRIDDNVSILARSGILEIVIENILDNAVSFSPRDSNITVTLRRSGHLVDLIVDDEGPGVHPSELESIFDRYFSKREKPLSSCYDVEEMRLPAHAGLGLWIVRRNVEALGGSIAATNRPSGGLSVRVTLPLNV